MPAKVTQIVRSISCRSIRGFLIPCSFYTPGFDHAMTNLALEFANLFAPGGNAYTNRRMAACLRDMEIILRYVTYAMLAGDASVLDDRCLNGLRETYQALGTPGSSVAVGVQKMKDTAIKMANDPNGITKGDCSQLMSELGGYFDRAAAAVA